MAALSATVDSGSGASGDYASLNALEAAEQQDLTDGGGDTFTATCTTTGDNAADTTPITWNGWITSPTNFISIEAAAGDEAVKSEFDLTRYRIDVASAVCLAIFDNHVRIIGIQFDTDGGEAINVANVLDGSDIRAISCRASGNNFLVEINDPDATVYVITCIADSSNRLGLVQSSAFVAFWNCIGWGSVGDGIEFNGTAVGEIINCALGNNGDDFDIAVGATVAIDHNASDDQDVGTNNVGPFGGDWNNEFEDPDNHDFTPKVSGNIDEGGIDDPGSGLFSLGMDGVAYVSPWWIGPNQIVSDGVDDLEADGISVSPEVGNPTLGQVHALGATGITVTPVMGTPVLAEGVDNLTAAGIAITPVLGTPTLGQVHALGATEISVSPEVGNPTIAQVHALGATEISVSPEVGNPTIAQVHALGATEISVAPVMGTPTLGQVHALVATRIATTPVLGTPTLGQVHALVATGITMTPVLGTPVLVEGAAAGLARMVFTTKIPGITFASSQPRMEITEE